MKKAIIIGGSTGIGRALADVLLDNDYKVGLTGIETEILESINQSTNKYLHAMYCDCTSDMCSDVVNTMIEWLGGLDLIVFSAGIGHLDEDAGSEVENEANELNILAFTEIADKAYRYFEKKGSGHFVTITSVAGIRGNRLAPAYHAAKSYQISYLDGIRQRAKKSKLNITITDIRPGFVETELVNKKNFWMTSKENAARQMYNLIKKKKNFGYVTKRWRLVAFLLRLIPNWLYNRL